MIELFTLFTLLISDFSFLLLLKLSETAFKADLMSYFNLRLFALT